MIRFYNGRVLRFGDALRVTEDEVWTNGDAIAYVGPKKADAPEFEREIDLKGNLLMPGFKNAHTHSAMTFLRSYADDLPLQSWLFDKVFPLEAKLAPQDVYDLTKLAILEYLTSGITAAFDMYFFNDAYVNAAIDCGFRTVLCGAVSDTSDRLEALEENHLKFNKFHPLVSHMLGFHAEYTCGERVLSYVAGLAEKYKAPVYTHNSETEAEVAGCIERYGVTPTELFDRMGIYKYGGGGFHCTYMTDRDLEIFKARGLWAVTNPGSNAKLASGIAPISRMMEKGVSLAIGTDGPASNNALDMFREMYLVTVLQKLIQKDAAACDADRVLEMATVGGAHAMGLDNCDVLEKGKQADLIVLDLNRPNMQPLNCMTKNIVYSGSKENVKMTMIAGKILYEDGDFYVGEDPERIYRRANEIITRIAGR